MELIKQLAGELSLRENQVQSAVQLIDDGNTIPFIARYRKEMTGALDDQVLRALFDRLSYLRGLEKRKEEVAAAIESQGKLETALAASIAQAKTLAEVEDLYRPYKQKRKTRASVAREKGLEPLAAFLRAQGDGDPLRCAKEYVDGEKEVHTAEEALAGAMDIIAEEISDDASLRKRIRTLLYANGGVGAQKADREAQPHPAYSTYDEFAQPLKNLPGHRVLALNRGEKDGYLKVAVTLDEEKTIGLMERELITKPTSACAAYLRQATADSWQRLLFPSLEREVRAELTDRANEQAIGVFALNLRHLLMQPPVKGRTVLGLDPAYRTGCKIAVVDDTGKVLATAVVYPTPPQKKTVEAKRTLTELIEKHDVSVISIGNGTASRESEEFVAGLVGEFSQRGRALSYMVVSEAGASVYSASKLAADEFPQFDVSLRSAASIARRLQDPLAELVKIDPQAIGVGQYQHDMPKPRLREALDGVVEDCVNAVGVDLNTASAPLLERVAGLGAAVAKNVVTYREEQGAFSSRKELLKVPKLGKKAYEQCAGFLRVPGAKNILDSTAVHPESYEAAGRLLQLCGYTLADVKEAKLQGLGEMVKQQGEALAQQAGVGLFTLCDIASELQKPGRDPRDELPPPLLKTDALKLEDLREGMVVSGTVRNVIDFGAFVDIGVHDDGLVHISHLCDRFVRHPSEVVKVGDIVKVKIISVDVEKRRIGLSMKL